MGENLYLFMIIALAVLAITDLVVGVSNDAVNFLNSAIGSKAISFRTVMIVASIGIAFGAISSSGMMEVARKGIFNPEHFVFAEIMIIFMAVMITDILLLDFFNTLGMPTSTTVSIVFELLGAAVAVSLVKIMGDGEGASSLWMYINTDKATEIILGILLSVVIAFTVGALVQFISRLLISFKFENKPSWVGAIFGGFALTSIIYFILVKGLKSASILSPEILETIANKQFLFILSNFVVWTLLSWMITTLTRINIYTIVIVMGTFALAMAFAGNDLVNFIGVPLAAMESYTSWSTSGIDANVYTMEGLATAVKTPQYLLLLSGMIMVVTLWFSSKAKNVVKTSVDLSRQDEGDERFQPNFLSRQIVRFSIKASENIAALIPDIIVRKMDTRFEKPYVYVPKSRVQDLPAFDLVRASVNLMVASVLISLATSMKLPLSTTYVTFMVAMGSSLADRAWGAESAVYRVAGVLNVIGGWFFTAISAFTAAALIAYIIHLGGIWAIGVLLIIAFFLIGKNYLTHTKKMKETKLEEKLERAESNSIIGVIEESAANISLAIKRANKIYTQSIDGLAKHDIETLRKSKKGISKFDKEVEDLRDNIFYFIKNLDESSVSTSNFYIAILSYLQDMTQSLEYIAKAGYKHVHNNHKKLRFNQIKDLKETDGYLDQLFTDIQTIFETKDFLKLTELIIGKQELFKKVDMKIHKQVERTRTDESSPKNTALYFSLLLETKDLLVATMNLLETYDQHANTKI
ncbi:inorganic phosphate transporter [Zobellia galactanivorans]|uniref:Phosphate transporter n=1 Tax=Zobellia galactanivorans (strain DSM 12802 / CCUG 47099 / CIP 106680 / NCIMB 13871 / Dsij) TaxID=63186 RepID=G0L568_ZOBGA|nr:MULTISPECIES: inorganic phosphate transporter [Zobellia]MBU3026518.1 inorganic phosphate transporter [Zobellia galactanivorans]MDO6516338.1 inorganic phosphate transporter [Zobellia uliginosa]MDO6809340.1 inorganic phosphate transporter [Zobellia galactanivorans]CAZ95984.1 Phosphate transporter family protein [Zobellia galactanivorans]